MTGEIIWEEKEKNINPFHLHPTHHHDSGLFFFPGDCQIQTKPENRSPPDDYSLFTVVKVTQESFESSREPEHPRDPREERTKRY